MALKQTILLVAIASSAMSQRGSFAGFRPIGYPEMATTTSTAVTDDLGNRFGEDNATQVSTTTQRLPVEANGDRDLIDRLSKLPQDSQPFWFINWQALEANRNNPQTYPLRPSGFAQALNPVTDNSGIASGFAQPLNPVAANTGPPNVKVNPTPTTSNFGFQSNVNVNDGGFGNRIPVVTDAPIGNIDALENKNGDNISNVNVNKNNQASTVRPENIAGLANRFNENSTLTSSPAANVDTSLGNKYGEDSNNKVSPVPLENKEQANHVNNFNNANENINKNNVPTSAPHKTPVASPSYISVPLFVYTNPLEHTLFNSQSVRNPSISEVHAVEPLGHVPLYPNRYQTGEFLGSRVPSYMISNVRRFGDDDYDFKAKVQPPVTPSHQHQYKNYFKGSDHFDYS